MRVMAKGGKVMVKVKVMNHETNLESHWLDVMAGHDMLHLQCSLQYCSSDTHNQSVLSQGIGHGNNS